MNLGVIPGYYFDQAKKKYFKIQANHVAPTGAKYAQSNVKHEQREGRKRKFEERQTAQRLKQTVRRSRLLNSTTAGMSVSELLSNRELGHQHRLHIDQEAVFASHLVPERIYVPPPNAACKWGSLQDIQYLGDDKAAVGFSGSANNSRVYIIDWPPRKGFSAQRSDERVWPVVAFNSTLIDLHKVLSPIWPEQSASSVIVAVAQEPWHPGNLYLGSTYSSQTLLQLGSSDSSIWSSSLDPQGTVLAVTGTDALHLVDIHSVQVTRRLSIESESRDITWLDPRTVAYGQQIPTVTTHPKPHNPSDHSPRTSHVALWDIRTTSGTSLRLSRHLPVTGLLSPSATGMNSPHLLVSSNKSLDCYDLRMPRSEALLSFQHVHQGPRLHFTSSSDPAIRVVAAVDFYNNVQLYSLRTGKSLGPLAQPASMDTALVRKPRFVVEEGGRGVMNLQICQGRSIVKWIWAGGEDE